jgi:hypothetical protein
VIVSARNQRQTDELNEAIGALSEQGKTMELFVLDQYRFATIDEALAELQRLKAGLVSFIVRISADV